MIIKVTNLTEIFFGHSLVIITLASIPKRFMIGRKPTRRNSTASQEQTMLLW